MTDEVKTEEQKDAEVHGTAAPEAVEHINQIPDVDYVREVLAREARNPKHPGGRKTVIAAAEARIAVLTPADEPASGDQEPTSGAAQDAASTAPSEAPASAPPPAEVRKGQVRCRVKATAGDFHLRRKVKNKDGELVEVFEPTAPGTELRLTEAEFRQNAGNLDVIE